MKYFSLKTEFPDRFYRFEPVTLVPFETNLIVTELLDKEQVSFNSTCYGSLVIIQIFVEKLTWINQYNALVRDTVGPELRNQNRTRAYNWLVRKTQCQGPCQTRMMGY